MTKMNAIKITDGQCQWLGPGDKRAMQAEHIHD